LHDEITIATRLL